MSKINLKTLQDTLPVKWKVQAYLKNKTIGLCVAYIDIRQIQDKLDQTVGQENWMTDFKEINGHLYGGIGIKINNEIIWKWDTGTADKDGLNPEKAETTDSLKRAAVQWGIGRWLYNLPEVFINIIDNKFPADENLKRIYDLSDYINTKLKMKKINATDNVWLTKPKKQDLTKEKNELKEMAKEKRKLLTENEYERIIEGINNANLKDLNKTKIVIKNRETKYLQALKNLMTEKLNVNIQTVNKAISKYKLTYDLSDDFEQLENYITTK